ncbi:MAG TPA: ferritin [Candidatus Nanoarchaeia archaeon]|nr:ferritin [Candidatus Nanoarchaeia archaeon]
MKLSKPVEDALNAQLHKEYAAAYLYTSMSAYFESLSLTGFAHWFKLQSKEEYGHADKLFRYIIDRDGSISLKKIDAPASTWSSPLKVVEDAYRHECLVTKDIYSVFELASKEKDHTTAAFLQWFLDEQVDEESEPLKVIEKIKRGGEQVGLLLLDKELSERKE